MAKPANKVLDALRRSAGAEPAPPLPEAAAPSPADTAAAAAAAAAATAAPAENPAPEERTDFPCSVAQERFWLLDRLDPGNASYNVAVRWRLEGRVLTDVLELAWLEILERHEILRSVFLEVDGAPVQRVMPRIPFRVNEIDLGTLQPDLQQAEGDRIGVIEARAPFDVATGPLIRVTLLRFSPSVSIILVTTHQIVSDGWSIGVMAHEMGVIYQALRRGSAPPLEPLPIQYADYSLWQLEWLRVRGTDAETAYWTRQLAGVKPFKIIADRERPAKPTTNGAIVSRVLPRALTNRAQSFSAERGATLFATVLAALCATLARYAGETDIVIGTQVSDRDQVELEPMIGQFVNSLILRNDLEGNPRFGDLVDQVRETVAQALEHRHIPIERLLGMVKGERGQQANAPSISVNFIFQKTFIQNAVYADFALIDMPSLPAGAIYDLNFFMVERPDGWRFSCQYNTDQFEGATALRLLDYYENVLDSAVSNPDRRLADLTLSGSGEARLLLARLNDTRTLYPRDLTLAKLIETHAARSPRSIAVVCGDRQLTYGELNAAANRVAGYLRTQGIRPGSRVGICLQASVELPICLLAVLKMGGVYVMVDAADPPLRRAQLLAASQTRVLIGQHWPRDDMPAESIKLIDIEAALICGVAAADAAPMPLKGSEATACLVFAAESSEASRLVGMSHRNLANLIYALAKRTGVGDRDVVVANSPLPLGRSSVELFLPLLTGARLVIARDTDRADGQALLQLLQRTQATVMYGGPSTWSALLEAGWSGDPQFKVFTPATGMNGRLIDQLTASSAACWGLFGYPEASVWSAIRRMQPKQAPLLVGEPLANTSLQILDSALQVAPVGATGELYIGGDGLAEVARPDAYVNVAGVRLLRTGDAGRLLAACQIEILSRHDAIQTYIDRPVDLEDIERALERHPDVAEALVVQTAAASGAATGAATGADTLVAYVVMRPRHDPAASPLEAPATAASAAVASMAQATAAIEKHLEQWLPQHLRPASVGVVESLPRTPDGKLDRQSWQTLKGTTAHGAAPLRPSGEIEERLAEIWTSMLRVPRVDATGNFFELGGHSLLAARMLAQVERNFGRRIKLATLFVAPTLREFAAIVAQGDSREFDFRQVVKIQPHGSGRPLIAINNTGIYYGLARCLGPEQPVYSLQLFDPSTKSSAMPQSLEDIAAGYVDLIRSVQPQGPYDLMGWCVAGALAFEIARQLEQDNREVAHLFLIDSWVPEYFNRQPKWRGLIGEYSLRLQLIFADWRLVMSREKTLLAFLSERKIFARWRRLMFKAEPSGETTLDDHATLETYDQWLLGYLQKVTAGYTPRPYYGRVTLLRSSLEPTGWFFHPDAGWAPFAPNGVDVKFVEGNHFSMFQHPGADQMAAHLANAIRS